MNVQSVPARTQRAKQEIWVTYFIEDSELGQIKIGKSRDVCSRFSDFRCGSPRELRFLCVLEGDREEELHARFAKLRLRPDGEWFKRAPAIVEFVESLRLWCPLCTRPSGIGPFSECHVCDGTGQVTYVGAIRHWQDRLAWAMQDAEAAAAQLARLGVASSARSRGSSNGRRVQGHLGCQGHLA